MDGTFQLIPGITKAQGRVERVYPGQDYKDVRAYSFVSLAEVPIHFS